MRTRILLAALLLLFGSTTTLFSGQAKAKRTLDIYFIDTEGGAATLIVTPAMESILIDAGFVGFEGRDAKRIEKAMQQAGVTAIDHIVASHYHADHYGGIPELARLVPIKHFYDHGKMTSLADDKQFAERYAAYQEAAHGRTTALKPGDTIPLKPLTGGPAIRIVCVSSNREVISGGKAAANAECSAAITKPEDPSDNARSVGLLLQFGAFEFLNLGDLTWNIAQRLVCPINNLGRIDLYQSAHHGNNTSNDPVLLHSIRPTAAVMNNGPKKGGSVDAIKWIRETSSVKALYQLHRNVDAKPEQNAPAEFIANLEEQPDEAYMIVASVDPAKKAFTITNGRTKVTKSYSLQ